ncbi:PGG domain [Sesbania bispinosa]|nr:PGG domain [Sesbania bispinosa]
MKGISKKIGKMHAEGLNNAINSNIVVVVLIATVAFAAIFNVPGQYPQNPTKLAPEMSLREANIAPNIAFEIFIIFDSTALFISLAVVVVQTSIVVIERKAKKQMTKVINKLMWIARVLISVAFLAMSHIIVGDQKELAIVATALGIVIMAATLGTLCYCAFLNTVHTHHRFQFSLHFLPPPSSPSSLAIYALPRCMEVPSIHLPHSRRPILRWHQTHHQRPGPLRHQRLRNLSLDLELLLALAREIGLRRKDFFPGSPATLNPIASSGFVLSLIVLGGTEVLDEGLVDGELIGAEGLGHEEVAGEWLVVEEKGRRTWTKVKMRNRRLSCFSFYLFLFGFSSPCASNF